MGSEEPVNIEGIVRGTGIDWVAAGGATEFLEHQPVRLSLSKPSLLSCALREGMPFDRLRANGSGDAPLIIIERKVGEDEKAPRPGGSEALPGLSR